MSRFRAILRQGGLWAALLLFLPSPGEGQEFSRAAASLLSGEPRLAAYALMRDQPAGGPPHLARLLSAQGLLPDGREGPVRLSASARAWPELRWDDNINGGIPGETINIGGLTFTVDEDSRAISGVVMGFGASLSADYRLAPARVLRLSSQLSAVHAPDHDFSRGSLSAQACLGQHLGDWRFVDLCTSHSLNRKTGSETSWTTTASIGTTTHFETGRAFHALSFGLRQTSRSEGYHQVFADLSLDSAVADIGALGWDLSIGEAVPGHHVTRYQAGMSWTRPIAGRRVTFDLGWQHEEGSLIFGFVPREDSVRRIGVTMDLTDRWSLRVGSQDRRSSVPVYDENRITFEVNWRPEAHRF